MPTIRTRSLLFTAALALALLAPGCQYFTGGLTLYAQDNRFNETNPTIRIPAGKSVKITVVNNEESRRHNLKIPALGINGKTLLPGESETITIPPQQPGEYRYTCSFHNKRMTGKLVVQEGLKKARLGD